MFKYLSKGNMMFGGSSGNIVAGGGFLLVMILIAIVISISIPDNTNTVESRITQPPTCENFNCSLSPNSLMDNPGSFQCASSNGCTSIECCTVGQVDCEGSWSVCGEDCTTTYSITTPASNGGTPCSYTDGQTTNCSNGDCIPSPPSTDPDPDPDQTLDPDTGGSETPTDTVEGGDTPVPDVDCVGSWSPCGTDCRETYSITTVESGGGATCPHPDGHKRPCSPGTDDCPVSVTSCETYDGCSGDGMRRLDEVACLESGCDEDTCCVQDCVGEWAVAGGNPVCVNCEQPYNVTIPAGPGGSDDTCVPPASRVRPCSSGAECLCNNNADSLRTHHFPGTDDTLTYSTKTWDEIQCSGEDSTLSASDGRYDEGCYIHNYCDTDEGRCFSDEDSRIPIDKPGSIVEGAWKQCTLPGGNIPSSKQSYCRGPTMDGPCSLPELQSDQVLCESTPATDSGSAIMCAFFQQDPDPNIAYCNSQIHGEDSLGKCGIERPECELDPSEDKYIITINNNTAHTSLPPELCPLDSLGEPVLCSTCQPVNGLDDDGVCSSRRAGPDSEALRRCVGVDNLCELVPADDQEVCCPSEYIFSVDVECSTGNERIDPGTAPTANLGGCDGTPENPYFSLSGCTPVGECVRPIFEKYNRKRVKSDGTGDEIYTVWKIEGYPEYLVSGFQQHDPPNIWISDSAAGAHCANPYGVDVSSYTTEEECLYVTTGDYCRHYDYDSFTELTPVPCPSPNIDQEVLILGDPHPINAGVSIRCDSETVTDMDGNSYGGLGYDYGWGAGWYCDTNGDSITPYGCGEANYCSVPSQGNPGQSELRDCSFLVSPGSCKESGGSCDPTADNPIHPGLKGACPIPINKEPGSRCNLPNSDTVNDYCSDDPIRGICLPGGCKSDIPDKYCVDSQGKKTSGFVHLDANDQFVCSDYPVGIVMDRTDDPVDQGDTGDLVKEGCSVGKVCSKDTGGCYITQYGTDELNNPTSCIELSKSEGAKCKWVQEEQYLSLESMPSGDARGAAVTAALAETSEDHVRDGSFMSVRDVCEDINTNLSPGEYGRIECETARFTTGGPKICDYIEPVNGECSPSSGEGICEYQKLGTCIPELRKTEYADFNTTSERFINEQQNVQSLIHTESGRIIQDALSKDLAHAAGGGEGREILKKCFNGQGGIKIKDLYPYRLYDSTVNTVTTAGTIQMKDIAALMVSEGIDDIEAGRILDKYRGVDEACAATSAGTDDAACAAADISGDATSSQLACEGAGECTYTHGRQKLPAFWPAPSATGEEWQDRYHSDWNQDPRPWDCTVSLLWHLFLYPPPAGSSGNSADWTTAGLMLDDDGKDWIFTATNPGGAALPEEDGRTLIVDPVYMLPQTYQNVDRYHKWYLDAKKVITDAQTDEVTGCAVMTDCSDPTSITITIPDKGGNDIYYTGDVPICEDRSDGEPGCQDRGEGDHLDIVKNIIEADPNTDYTLNTTWYRTVLSDYNMEPLYNYHPAKHNTRIHGYYPLDTCGTYTKDYNDPIFNPISRGNAPPGTVSPLSSNVCQSANTPGCDICIANCTKGSVDLCNNLELQDESGNLCELSPRCNWTQGNTCIPCSDTTRVGDIHLCTDCLNECSKDYILQYNIANDICEDNRSRENTATGFSPTVESNREKCFIDIDPLTNSGVCAECEFDSDCVDCIDNNSECTCDGGRCVKRKLCPNDNEICNNPSLNPSGNRMTFMHEDTVDIPHTSKVPPGFSPSQWRDDSAISYRENARPECGECENMPHIQTRRECEEYNYYCDNGQQGVTHLIQDLNPPSGDIDTISKISACINDATNPGTWRHTKWISKDCNDISEEALIDICCTDKKPYGRACWSDTAGSACPTKGDLNTSCVSNCKVAMDKSLNESEGGEHPIFNEPMEHRLKLKKMIVPLNDFNLSPSMDDDYINAVINGLGEEAYGHFCTRFCDSRLDGTEGPDTIMSLCCDGNRPDDFNHPWREYMSIDDSELFATTEGPIPDKPSYNTPKYKVKDDYMYCIDTDQPAISIGGVCENFYNNCIDDVNCKSNIHNRGISSNYPVDSIFRNAKRIAEASGDTDFALSGDAGNSFIGYQCRPVDSAASDPVQVARHKSICDDRISPAFWARAMAGDFSHTKGDYRTECLTPAAGVEQVSCEFYDPMDHVLGESDCQEGDRGKTYMGRDWDSNLSDEEISNCMYRDLVNCMSYATGERPFGTSSQPISYSSKLCSYMGNCIGGPKDASDSTHCGECIDVSPTVTDGQSIRQYQKIDEPGWSSNIEDRTMRQNCGPTKEQVPGGAFPEATCRGPSWATEEHHKLCHDIFENNKRLSRTSDGTHFNQQQHCRPAFDCSIFDGRVAQCGGDPGATGNCYWEEGTERCLSNNQFCEQLSISDCQPFLPSGECIISSANYFPDIGDQCSLADRGSSFGNSALKCEKGGGGKDICSCACPTARITSGRNLNPSDPNYEAFTINRYIDESIGVGEIGYSTSDAWIPGDLLNNQGLVSHLMDIEKSGGLECIYDEGGGFGERCINTKESCELSAEDATGEARGKWIPGLIEQWYPNYRKPIIGTYNIEVGGECTSHGDCVTNNCSGSSGTPGTCSDHVLGLPGSDCNADAECSSGYCVSVGGTNICSWGGSRDQDFLSGESIQDKICEDILGVWDKQYKHTSALPQERKKRCMQGGDIDTAEQGTYESAYMGDGDRYDISSPEKDIIWKLSDSVNSGICHPIYDSTGNVLYDYGVCFSPEESNKFVKAPPVNEEAPDRWFNIDREYVAYTDQLKHPHIENVILPDIQAMAVSGATDTGLTAWQFTPKINPNWLSSEVDSSGSANLDNTRSAIEQRVCLLKFDDWKCSDTYFNHKYSCCGRPGFEGAYNREITHDYQSSRVGGDPEVNTGFGTSPACGGIQEELTDLNLAGATGTISNTWTRGEYQNTRLTNIAARQGARKMKRELKKNPSGDTCGIGRGVPSTQSVSYDIAKYLSLLDDTDPADAQLLADTTPFYTEEYTPPEGYYDGICLPIPDSSIDSSTGIDECRSRLTEGYVTTIQPGIEDYGKEVCEADGLCIYQENIGFCEPDTDSTETMESCHLRYNTAVDGISSVTSDIEDQLREACEVSPGCVYNELSGGLQEDMIYQQARRSGLGSFGGQGEGKSNEWGELLNFMVNGEDGQGIIMPDGTQGACIPAMTEEADQALLERCPQDESNCGTVPGASFCVSETAGRDAEEAHTLSRDASSEIPWINWAQNPGVPDVTWPPQQYMVSSVGRVPWPQTGYDIHPVRSLYDPHLRPGLIRVSDYEGTITAEMTDDPSLTPTAKKDGWIKCGGIGVGRGAGCDNSTGGTRMASTWSEDYVNTWESDELLFKIITENDYCACVGGGWGTGQEQCGSIGGDVDPDACKADERCNWWQPESGDSVNYQRNSSLSERARQRLDAITTPEEYTLSPIVGVQYDGTDPGPGTKGGGCHSKRPDSWIEGHKGESQEGKCVQYDPYSNTYLDKGQILYHTDVEINNPKCAWPPPPPPLTGRASAGGQADTLLLRKLMYVLQVINSYLMIYVQHKKNLNI